MQSPRGRRSMEIAGVALVLAQLIPAANADPITVPGYTVTDLGIGTPTFGTDSSGNGILSAPTGQTFAFSQTPNTVLIPGQGMLANLPQLQPPPYYGGGDYGNPSNAFSYVTSALMNASGMVLATNVAGIYGHEYSTSLFEIQHNPDGTWGQPQSVYADGGQFQLQGIGPGAYGWLSKSNEVLIQDSTNPYGITILFVYNANTQNPTDIYSLLPPARYFQLQPIAIDDLGRIVLSAELNDPAAGYPETNLLLTPEGVSSAPVEAPVPGPGAMAVMLLAAMSFAIGRVRERRRRC